MQSILEDSSDEDGKDYSDLLVILKKMLQFNPYNRATAQECLDILHENLCSEMKGLDSSAPYKIEL